MNNVVNKVACNILTLFFFLLLTKYADANNYPPCRQFKAHIEHSQPTIDGILDDFEAKDILSNFTTYEPIPGQPSQYKTEVKTAFLEDGFYVAAKLFDNPKDIYNELSARDMFSNSDYFGVILDPFQGGVTGFGFFVTSAGVQIDQKFNAGEEDVTWNEVWESKVTKDEDGWNVEIKIPYYSLRFPNKQQSAWNIQFVRSVRKTRELSYWNAVSPEKDGILTQMGIIQDVKKIKSPLRLSLKPYFVTGLETRTFNQLKSNVSYNYSGGASLKYGINESFTLNTTIVPDFSQVVSDLQLLNLTPFEFQFSENRPFFKEGTNLFNRAGIFYSRRIGGSPYKSVPTNEHQEAIINGYTLTKSTSTAPLINATKLTGRMNNNVGIGVLNAIEGNAYQVYEHATLDPIKKQVNAFTNYNVFVLDKLLKNNSYIAFTNTNVYRKEGTNANVSAVQFNLRNKAQNYALKGQFNHAFRSVSTNNQGYFFDFSFQDVAGSWIWEIGAQGASKDYNPNDLGFFYSINQKQLYGSLTYRNFKPKYENLILLTSRNTVSKSYQFSSSKFQDITFRNYTFLKFKSFLGTGLISEFLPFGKNDFYELRSSDINAFIHLPAFGKSTWFISTDYRKPLALDWQIGHGRSIQHNQQLYFTRVKPRIRINDHFSIFPHFEVSYTINEFGYAFRNPSQTYIGKRDVKRIQHLESILYHFNNNISLRIALSHIYSRVLFKSFYVPDQSGELISTDVSEKDLETFNQNLTYNFYNLEAFFNYRFAPGSDISISYRSPLRRYDNIPITYLESISGLGQSFTVPSVSLKVIYFLDINRLTRRVIQG